MNNSKNRNLAVVTGASPGIGHELAEQFARNGFDLFIPAEDEGIETAFRQDRRSVPPYALYESIWRNTKAWRSCITPSRRWTGQSKRFAINAGAGVNGDFARETDLEEN